ncbi:MAG: VaFE repeat-containing surface-anchored protein [Coriobacteriaceae bacterium]|nr:VaFE repeat-containing surface-anchored protein [Coriobacteriaceae bacterium]
MKSANKAHPDAKSRGNVRSAVSGFMAAVLTLSAFMGSGVTTAYAATYPGTSPSAGSSVTVTLTDAEHGSISFKGTDERKLTVEHGSEVDVVVTPDEGYTTDSLGVVDADGDMVPAEVVDGVAKVRADKDVTVLAAFYEQGEGGDGNTAAFNLLEPVAQKRKARSASSAFMDDKGYILSHMDGKYVGDGSELTLADSINTTITVVDGSEFEGETLDDLWKFDDDGNDVNSSALINQTVALNNLYSVSDDADYYVGRVGVDMDGAHVSHWAASKNNALAEMLDDIVYDEETGLVYVPKKYTEHKGGKTYILATRIQLMYKTDGPATDASVSVQVNVNADGVDGKLVNSGVAKSSVYTVGTEIELAKDDEARKAIDGYTIDSIVLNGTKYEDPEGVWEYNPETGRLMVYVSPVGLTTVEVNMSDTLGKKADGFFRSAFGEDDASEMRAMPRAVSDVFGFPSNPYVGQKFDVDAGNIYQSGGMGGFERPLVDAGHLSAGKFEINFVHSAFGDNVYPTGNLTGLPSSFIARATHIYKQYINGIEIPDMQLNLLCAHINMSVGGDNGLPSLPAVGTEFKGKARVSVHSVNGFQLVIGVVNPAMGGQSGAGFFRVGWKPMGGYLSLTKMSAKPDWTDGNSGYDLTGAEYGVYTDYACSNKVATLKVQNNTGVTNETFLQAGDYYVKETKAPNKGYDINPEVKKVSVVSGQHTNVKLEGAMKEPPLDDPIRVMVQKAVDGRTEAGKPEGDMPNLGGVKFRVSYYNNVYASAAEAERHQATASAVFETDNDGRLSFVTASPVDGTTWPYKTGSGNNTFPIGTGVIREISTPDGLIVKGTAYAFTVTDDGNHAPKLTVIGKWSNKPAGGVILDNTMEKGGVTVSKADAESHTQNPQGDGSLMGIEYSIYNKSKNPVTVVVDGKNKDVPVDGLVMKIYTNDVDGKPIATTGNNVLPFGSYRIVETNGNASYGNADWAQDFQIRENGQMVAFGSAAEKWNENLVKRGGMYIVKGDRDTGLSVPQGDATLANTSYEIFNRSAKRVYVNGSWFDKDAKIMTIQTSWDDSKNAYVAATGERVLPYGTYEIVEVGAPQGYHKADYKHTFHITEQGQMVALKDAASNYNVDAVFRGGVSVVKADKDLHGSYAQGDGSLDGIKYNIVNRSANAVVVDRKSYAPGETVKVLTTKWNDEKRAYIAATDAHTLPYGTYDIVEVSGNDSYLNAGWKQTFTIRQDGEMHYFDNKSAGANGSYEFHHEWNENAVKRGGVIVGKVDRETGQYIGLGEAHLDGATFEIVNKSKADVVVDGKRYAPNKVVKTIASKAMEYDGRDIYAAATEANTLPYGTYELREVSSGKGYLFDSTSKQYKKTFSIREDGQMIDFTDESEAVANQVIREDWHFQKKAEDSMERMDRIAFLVTSQTTGEKHVIVTDENGTWGSAWNAHTNDTNANDPTAPNTNGAMGVKEDGTWYVKDSSLLDFEAGTWFTGMSPDMTEWSEDGASYTVNGKTVAVNDALRSFPYDTYTVQELRCDNNKGYALVNFTVTLHRYTADHDGPGLDIDYGTIDDKAIALGTDLTYGAADKVAPAVENAVLRDAVTYDNLDVNAKYTLKGELHAVNDDGSDGGVVATAEKEINSGTGTGRTVVEFEFDARELAGKSVVAFEYLMQNGSVIAEHADITDENQTVKFPEIGTTLKGDMNHASNAAVTEVTLTDKVSYKNLEVGKQYTLTGTLYDPETGEAVLDADGKAVTAQKTFSPVSEEGATDVVFTFKVEKNALAGKTVVAFEELSMSDVVYAVHADIDDEAQMVMFPAIDTVATDEIDGNHEIAEMKGQSIVDKITLSNLDEDLDYYVVGELHVRNADGTDAGVLTDEDGEPVVAKTDVFTGSEGNHEPVYLTFEDIDASELGGKDIVVFDKLITVGMGPREAGAEVVLGEHADIDDADQTVHVPHVSTTMLSDKDIHEIQVPQGEDKSVTLTDTVSYENVTPGRDYVVDGELHLVKVSEDGEVSDGGVFKDKDGKAVKASAEFTAEDKDGTVDVTFEFDATGLDGESVVAFESLTRKAGDSDKGQVVAIHADIADEGQTVRFVDMGTALEADNGTHETQVPDEGAYPVHLTDTVEYENLIPGHEYTLNGALHYREVKDGAIVDGGEVLDVDGNVVTGQATFTPTEPNGSVEVVFDFEAEGLDGKTIVAFESMSHGGKEFAVHADIEDEAQTVRFVDIETTALAGNGIHETQVPVGDDKTVTLTDTVEYENLIPGTEYTVEGVLHVRSVSEDGSIADAGALKDKDGNEVKASAAFTPETADGEVEVEFEFDAADLDGKSVTVFETLSKEGVVLATHADIEDDGQTVRFVKMSTELTSDGIADSEAPEAEVEGEEPAVIDGVHVVQVPQGEDKSVTLVDKVHYENLIPGTEYTVKGSLHIKGVSLFGNVKDGGVMEGTTAEVKFTPETHSGSVDVTFTSDASEMAGLDVVAFESIYRGDALVAEHADMEDMAQTVQFVDVATKAIDKTTGNQMVAKGDKVTVVDTVEYTNLIPGHGYTVEGTLHVQKVDDKGEVTDGGVLKDKDGNEVKASAQFVPEDEDGTVDVTFEFAVEPGVLDGQTLVAFEELSEGGIVFATHADIKDEAQSVHAMKVGTTLTGADGEAKDIQSAKKVDVVDVIAYENLVPGQEYKVVGKLVDAKGEALSGEKATVEATFTPKEASGKVEVVFSIDTSNLKDGDKVVAFEYIYSGDVLIGSHEDLGDANQTVVVKIPSETPKDHVDLTTGIDNNAMGVAIAMLVIVTACGGYILYKRRKIED